MTARKRELLYYLGQPVLFLSVVLFALYQFQRHTLPQPIYFTNAENDLKAGRESAARKEFDDALRLRPNDPAAYLSVIQSCAAQNKPALQVEYAFRAVDACKNQPREVRSELYATLAMAYSNIERSPHQEHAVAAAKKAFDLSPDSRIMQNAYGYLLADNALGPGPDVDTALALLKKALDRPKGVKFDASLAQLGPLFVAESEDSYGWALYKNSQYPDALTELTQALEDYPEEASGDVRKVSCYHLGMVYRKLGRSDQAANALNSALAYDPKFDDALAGLAGLTTDKTTVTSRPTANTHHPEPVVRDDRHAELVPVHPK